MTAGEDAYQVALESLSRVLVDAETLRDTLEQLLAVVALATPAVTALTVTAVDDEDGELTSAASTDRDAQQVDEREYAMAEGPCIDALATGAEQLIRDVTRDQRWPRFNEVAATAGFRAVAGLPLRTPQGVVIGALNVFSVEPDGISERDLEILRRVCPPAAAVLANARAYRRTRSLSDQLAATLEHRALVHRAVGVLLGRHGGTTEAALQRLQEHADREGVALPDVAERVVAGDLDPTP